MDVELKDAYGVWLYEKLGDKNIYRVDLTVRDYARTDGTYGTPSPFTVQKWLQRWSERLKDKGIRHAVFHEYMNIDSSTYKTEENSFDRHRPHGHAALYAENELLASGAAGLWNHGFTAVKKATTPLMTYRYIAKEGDLINAWLG